MSGDGKITLPIEVVNSLDLRVGSKLDLIKKTGMIILKPARN